MQATRDKCTNEGHEKKRRWNGQVEGCGKKGTQNKSPAINGALFPKTLYLVFS